MKLLIVLLVAKLCVLSSSHPYDHLNIIEIIKGANYPVEVHNLDTADGYTLTFHRIPHGVKNNVSREVVMIAHGMGGAPENFVVRGPNDALGFYLADEGYDVWLFNARGTSHSRKHKTLDPIADRKKFWDFSWHEISVYDIPATIDYILATTGKEKISFVGHSQGVSNFFVLLSEIPEMSNKIKVAGLLTPSIYLNYTQSPYVRILSRISPLIQNVLRGLSWYEMLTPNSILLNGVLKFVCKIPLFTDTCIDLLSIVGGAFSGYIEKDFLPAVVHFTPSGFGIRQPFHYAQIVNTGEFKQYDWGEKENLKVYNSTKPPFYNFDAAKKVPIGLVWAPQDQFGNKKMLDALMRLLPNIVFTHEVTADAFNHLDFALGSVVKKEVYEPLYSFLKQYED